MCIGMIITLSKLLEGKINQTRIKDVLHVSNLHVNFLSMSNLVSKGSRVQFNLNNYIVKFCKGVAIAIMSRKRNLY